MTARKALLIGNNYSGDSKLAGCVNDANNMSDYLKYRNYTTNVQTELSHADFVKTCADFFGRARQNDTLYFHFSGHGFQTKDRNADEDDGKDEAVVLGDGSGFVDDDINKLMIEPLRSLRITVVMVFDTCHSGTMCDLRYIYKSGRTPTYNPKYPANNAMVISISGCGDSQTSADTVMNGQAQGALTGAMIQVLKRCNNGELLCDFMDKLRAYLKKAGYTQVPIMCSSRPVDTLMLREAGLL